MNRTSTILLPLLVAAGAAAALAAQSAGAGAVPGFDGGIRWGASVEQVSAYWREQPTGETREGTIRMIAFRPWQRMNWTLYVDDRAGLIGLYAVSLEELDAGTCEQVFDGLVRAMRASFPGVAPAGEKRAPGDEALCPAVAAGRARAAFDWTQQGSGVRARVWVQRENGRVGYMMGTRAFQEWTVRRLASPPSAAPDTAAAAPARDLGVRPRAFRAIRPGMSYGEVAAVVGQPGTETAADGTTGSATYTWRGGAGRSIAVAFVADRAVLAMQTGLDEDAVPVSLAQYRRLRAGMTYGEAVRVMGGAGIYDGFTEMAGSVAESYLWRGRSPGSVASASFSHGRLTMAMQMGVG